MQLRRLEEVAGKEFDAKAAEYTVKAKELYLVEKNKYRVPEQINASQILFDFQHRTPEEALARRRRRGGSYRRGGFQRDGEGGVRRPYGQDQRRRDRLVHARPHGSFDFRRAAFDMKNVGDISEPIKSRFGYHLIRFEGRRAAEVRPFEAVEPRIMADLRKRYVETQRDARTAAIRLDPDLKVNEPAIDALVHPFNPELFGAPKRGSVGPIRGDRDKKGASAPQ